MIVKHTDPWTHYTWEDFLTFDEQKYVYDQCLDVLDVQSYHDDSFFYLNGEIQNNAGLHLNYGNELHNKIMSQLYEFSNLIGYTDNVRWSFNSTITKDFKQKQLFPHNDDYEELKQYGNGMLKVLIYLGNGTDDYTDWGTKLYKTAQRESFEKEVKYQPGTCFVFEANKYSYHGTDFTNDVNGYRFMISGELVESNDNE
jgi:hypothetical protein|tara:strand:- start:1480 stop:2076 length:597 start_codon:yes stop_codon:yes gene_type:complete